VDSSNLSYDYTQIRAYEVYDRDEYTRWLLQSRILGGRLEPLYYVEVVAIRGTYVIFTHGYVDQDIHRLAFAPIDPIEPWWKSMLDTIRFFYVESKFYGPR